MPIRGFYVSGLLASACLVGLPQLAHGAAFQLREDSAVGLGTAFAGSASSALGPSTVFDNPAGMTQLPGMQVQLGGSIIGPSFTFQGTNTSALGQPISGSDNRNGGNTALVPNGYFTYQVTPDLFLGLAVTTPFGLATTYGSNFVGRYQSDKSTLETININPAIAYRVTPWLSLGAGVSAQYARATFSNFLNSQTIGYQATGRVLPLTDGYFNLRGDDWEFGYNLGALIQPGPLTNIGLAYRSRVDQKFEGNANFILPTPLNLSSRFLSSGGSAKLVLPDTATISITQKLTPDWTLYAETSWTNWSQFKNLNVFRDDGSLISSTPERYHNSIFASIGASYRVNDVLTLRAGTAYDESPVSNAYRTAQVPDQDRYWLAGGVSYQVLPGTAIDFGYAHIFVKDSSLNQVSATGDVLRGKYSNSIEIVSLGVRSRF